ncbi:MAG TPA: ATP-binding protein [Gammaproteobacteria bacterium]|nr:ATP-binding protein [Gammaproteobacteria bacterium]
MVTKLSTEAADARAPSITLLPQIAPLRILLASGLMVTAVVWIAVSLSIHVPWLGLSLVPSPHGHGLTVTSSRGASARAGINPGTVIQAIRTGNGHTVPLGPRDLMPEPDVLGTFGRFNAFFSRQYRIWDALQHPGVHLVTGRGRSVALPVSDTRPLISLPLRFWILLLCGATACMMGMGAWSFRRGQTTTRLFMLGGIGYLFGAAAAAIYVSRELVLDPLLFRSLAELNHLGVLVFAYATLGLLWHYPRRLGRFPAATLVMLVALAVWVNEIFQWHDWPVHSFYLPIIATVPASVVFAGSQWRRSAGMPLERAALKWFLLSVFLSLGVALALFFVPVVIDQRPLSSIDATFAIVLMMYAGLALGIFHYRLFELERWWFKAWVWFLGGLALIAIDLLLVMLFDLNRYISLGVAVVFISWVYLPLRQWLWRRMNSAPRARVDDYLPELIEALFSARSPAGFGQQWQRLLEQVFEPLDIELREGPRIGPTIRDNGLTMDVPTLNGQRGFRLSYARRGNRLFSLQDTRLAAAMLEVTRRSGSLRQAQEAGVRTERERIMRDLHDDVGARLLTLVHNAERPRNAELARLALKALRETIYSLDETAAVPVADALSDWRAELADRLQDTGIHLAWSQEAVRGEIGLTPRQRINLNRILQEAVSNALRHASAGRIEVDVSFQRPRRLLLRVRNDGLERQPSIEIPGKGLHNIVNRAKELHGEARWYTELVRGGWAFVVEASLPLGAEES